MRLGEGGEGTRCRRACCTRARARRQWAASIIHPNSIKHPWAKWVEAAGRCMRPGDGGEGMEVPPRISYIGEGPAPMGCTHI